MQRWRHERLASGSCNKFKGVLGPVRTMEPCQEAKMQ